jgi:hypothetical protein
VSRKSKTEIKLGATVRLRVHSGEIVEGRVVYLWDEKSVAMLRVASGDLVYNVPRVCWSMNGNRNDIGNGQGIEND